MTVDAPGPEAGPLPPRRLPRLPGERLLRRRAPMLSTETISSHPEGLFVRRGIWTAVVLRGNQPIGALWRDLNACWRAAPGTLAALVVSGDPDDEVLEVMEVGAPCFHHFAKARDWLLGALAGPKPSPSSPDGTDPGSERADRDGGERRGEVIQFTRRRAARR